MFERHEMIPSQVMGRQMHMWRFGHYGAPLLAFPSASGMAHEWQAHGMVEALSDLINGGKIKLYCTESNVAEAWTHCSVPKPSGPSMVSDCPGPESKTQFLTARTAASRRSSSRLGLRAAPHLIACIMWNPTVAWGWP